MGVAVGREDKAAINPPKRDSNNMLYIGLSQRKDVNNKNNNNNEHIQYLLIKISKPFMREASLNLIASLQVRQGRELHHILFSPVEKLQDRTFNKDRYKRWNQR